MIKVEKILLILLSLVSLSAFANDKYVVNIDGLKIYLDKNNLSTVIVENDMSGKRNKCNIENWRKYDTDNGDGIIRGTTDKRAIIFYSSSRYLLINELIQCKNGQVKLYDSPHPDIAMLQDINFEKHLYLSLGLVDKDSWAATIANFGSDESLIIGPGFFDKSSNSLEEGFAIFDGGYGKISPDGKYVSPNGLYCEGDYTSSTPGVWNIEKRKRVTFPYEWGDLGRIMNLDEISEKCRKLFYGEATLEELGGKLNDPVYIQSKGLKDKNVIVENINNSKIIIPLKKGIYNAYANTQINSIDGHGYLAIFQKLPSKPRGSKGRCSGNAETWLYIYELSNKKAKEVNKILVGSCNKGFSMKSLNNNMNDYSSFSWNKSGFVINWHSKKDKQGKEVNHTNYVIKKGVLMKEDVMEANGEK
ncbi:hypothetical protein Ppb6_02211 [Photorhabdus australis subsp. thailandensis]|uniref:Uncharacterized protein n=1 Tax=Photorhabdus australis subsp. thailandensis TaxID=2805096 RepID=A0A1C0U3U9_9GAMM|nr:hypothetical protein [Photorhabdus australis]OCQ52598.1 hypothetical protein Ppb6_02211 [Photorhabdus australis subsp. thailandensis]